MRPSASVGVCSSFGLGAVATRWSAGQCAAQTHPQPPSTAPPQPCRRHTPPQALAYAPTHFIPLTHARTNTLPTQKAPRTHARTRTHVRTHTHAGSPCATRGRAAARPRVRHLPAWLSASAPALPRVLAVSCLRGCAFARLRACVFARARARAPSRARATASARPRDRARAPERPSGSGVCVCVCAREHRGVAGGAAREGGGWVGGWLSGVDQTRVMLGGIELLAGHHVTSHQWSSGRIHRCHRCDPGSIPS